MTTILLTTAGNTDLQIVFTDKKGEREVRSRPGELRAFHESLINGTENWVIYEDGVELREYLYIRDIAPSSSDYLRDDQNRLRIIPAKLKRIADTIGRIDAAVVFATRRDAQSQRNDEPVAVGPVLAGWLEARASNDVSSTPERAVDRITPWNPEAEPWPGGARWVNLLRGQEHFEGDSDRHPIHRKLLNRLHASMKAIHKALEPEARIFVAATGGIPQIKEVLTAMARLVFGVERVKIIVDPQQAETPRIFGADTPQPPEEAYRLREAALIRVRSGDLEGAAAFATRATGDDWETVWTRPVREAAQWLAGHGLASPAESYLKNLGDKRSFLIAARAEAALKGDRIREAVIASDTFMGAALLDAIETLTWVAGIDDVTHALTLAKGASVPSAFDKLVEHRNNGTLKCKITSKSTLDWIARLAPDQCHALTDMGNAFRQKTAGLPRCAAYRNAAVHGRLSGSRIENAKKSFKNRKIWSNTEPVRLLYAGSLAQKVMESLGISNAAELIDGLFEELANAILSRAKIQPLATGRFQSS
ncbi:MAG: hypothetical protein ACRDFQ_01590 [Anaerolineales bacterium]